MVYQGYNDFELVYLVQEKDDSSYNILFNKYMPIIKRIAIGYYKSFNHYGYDLDDFIQEGYLCFHKALRSYDEKKDVLFYSFVVLCVQRGLISFCRRISSDSKNISNEYLLDFDSVPIMDGSSDTEQDFINKELFNNIWNVVYDFPIEYACVFELRFNHFKYNEISVLLDIPTRKAQFINRLIIKELRKQLSI